MLLISRTHLGGKMFCCSFLLHLYYLLTEVNILLYGRTFVCKGILLLQICSNLVMLLKQLDVSATY